MLYFFSSFLLRYDFLSNLSRGKGLVPIVNDLPGSIGVFPSSLLAFGSIYMVLLSKRRDSLGLFGCIFLRTFFKGACTLAFAYYFCF
jgi:hypothetical protein